MGSDITDGRPTRRIPRSGRRGLPGDRPAPPARPLAVGGTGRRGGAIAAPCQSGAGMSVDSDWGRPRTVVDSGPGGPRVRDATSDGADATPADGRTVRVVQEPDGTGDGPGLCGVVAGDRIVGLASPGGTARRAAPALHQTRRGARVGAPVRQGLPRLPKRRRRSSSRGGRGGELAARRRRTPRVSLSPCQDTGSSPSALPVSTRTTCGRPSGRTAAKTTSIT